MKKIYQKIIELGYKKTGKSINGSQMFEKGNEVIYIQKIIFKPQKQLTFQQRVKSMYK